MSENIHLLKELETWNNLPSSVVSAPTVRSFEGRLDKLWENQPRKYDYNQAILMNTTEHP